MKSPILSMFTCVSLLVLLLVPSVTQAQFVELPAYVAGAYAVVVAKNVSGEIVNSYGPFNPKSLGGSVTKQEIKIFIIEALKYAFPMLKAWLPEEMIDLEGFGLGKMLATVDEARKHGCDLFSAWLEWYEYEVGHRGQLLVSLDTADHDAWGLDMSFYSWLLKKFWDLKEVAIALLSASSMMVFLCAYILVGAVLGFFITMSTKAHAGGINIGTFIGKASFFNKFWKETLTKMMGVWIGMTMTSSIKENLIKPVFIRLAELFNCDETLSDEGFEEAFSTGIKAMFAFDAMLSSKVL